MTLETTDILAELAAGRIPIVKISDELPGVEQLRQIVANMSALQQFSTAIANGDLSSPLPVVKGPLAGSLKMLHASLKHLTWQTKQIAEGDFSQRVDFMGEFASSFNLMVEHLEESRANLEIMNVRLQKDNIKLLNMTEALRESEERFRHIAENVNDVIWTLNSSMERFTYISPSIANMRGLSVVEAMHEPIEQSMTPESLACMRKTLADKLVNQAEVGDSASKSTVT